MTTATLTKPSSRDETEIQALLVPQRPCDLTRPR